MTDLLTPVRSNPILSLEDAIHQRRSVRNYTHQALGRTTVNALLNAAVLAPTAMHQEPWSFVVIQDKDVLDRLSDKCIEMVREEAKGGNSPTSQHRLHVAGAPKLHAFHGAGTLIIICGQFSGPFVEADCWLAAENLMLAACAEGLGTCVIGFAVEALNTAEWKAECKIPSEMAVIAPSIVGVPAGETAATSRKPPEILLWK
jgi:nitroreductase